MNLPNPSNLPSCFGRPWQPWECRFTEVSDLQTNQVLQRQFTIPSATVGFFSGIFERNVWHCFTKHITYYYTFLLSFFLIIFNSLITLFSIENHLNDPVFLDRISQGLDSLTGPGYFVGSKGLTNIHKVGTIESQFIGLPLRKTKVFHVFYQRFGCYGLNSSKNTGMSHQKNNPIPLKWLVFNNKPLEILGPSCTVQSL